MLKFNEDHVDERRSLLLKAIEAVERGDIQPIRARYVDKKTGTELLGAPCMACAIGTLFYVQDPETAGRELPKRYTIEAYLNPLFARIELDVIEEVYMATMQDTGHFWSSSHSELEGTSPVHYEEDLCIPEERKEAELLVKARELGRAIRTEFAREIGTPVEVPEHLEEEFETGDAIEDEDIETSEPSYQIEIADPKLALLNKTCMLRLFALMLENNTKVPMEGLYA